MSAFLIAGGAHLHLSSAVATSTILAVQIAYNAKGTDSVHALKPLAFGFVVASLPHIVGGATLYALAPLATAALMAMTGDRDAVLLWATCSALAVAGNAVVGLGDSEAHRGVMIEYFRGLPSL